MLQSNQTPAATGEWECMECNHILEGTALQRPARCPECNAGPEAFEFFSYEDEELEGDVEEEEDRPKPALRTRLRSRIPRKIVAAPRPTSKA